MNVTVYHRSRYINPVIHKEVDLFANELNGWYLTMPSTHPMAMNVDIALDVDSRGVLPLDFVNAQSGYTTYSRHFVVLTFHNDWEPRRGWPKTIEVTGLGAVYE